MRPTLAAVTLLCASSAAAGDVFATFPSPSMDLWMYPFTSSPGTRPVVSTFGSTPGDTNFDSRDGQMLVGFATAAQIPTGRGSTITVTRARLTVEVANDLNFAYDPTTDPWQCFVASSDPAWQADADAGQPVECFGVGFRNGLTLQTFVETTPYAPSGTNPMLSGVRNAFAASFDGSGALVDVSQSPRQRVDPKVWATGQIDGQSAGALVPAGSQMRFDLDVSDPAIQAYLRSSLDAGKLMLAVTSLTFVQQGSGQYPAFVAKENSLVTVGAALPARLEIDVTDTPCAIADFNCDGHVDGADLGLLLGRWGTPDGDLNGDGTTDGADLGLLLGRWG